MRMKRTMFLCLSIASVVVVGGFATKGFADNETTTIQQKASPEKMLEAKESTDQYVTHYGVFQRVPSQQPFAPSEIAYSDNEINGDTKEIITDFGIFVKKD